MNALQVIGLTVITILSAICYRLGGGGKCAWEKWKEDFKNIPKWLFNTKVRDFGCAILTALAILLFWRPADALAWWMLGLSTFILFGALTTYNKWFQAYIFGYPKEDVYWPSWTITGFFYGLAVLPLAFAWGGIFWSHIVFRAVILSILTVLWSEINSEVVFEECGRGAFIPLTVPILFL